MSNSDAVFLTLRNSWWGYCRKSMEPIEEDGFEWKWRKSSSPWKC